MSASLGVRPTTHFAPRRDLTADAPPELRGLGRDGVRLLVARGGRGGVALEHTTFGSFADHVRPGDVLVVNNSATVAGEVDGLLVARGPVVVHVAMELDDCSWVVELRTAPDAARPILDAAPGDDLLVGPHRLRLAGPYPDRGSSPTGSGNRVWRVREVDGCSLASRLEQHGRPIAYGYLRGRFPLADYQTVFGAVPGSAEMASAARPFTAELVSTLVAHGVVIVPVTLHTGLSSQEVGEAPMPERFSVSGTTAAVVNALRAGGGRVIAVGTTATRAIESAVDESGVVHAAAGWTERVVTPADPPRVVRGLVTGWHDPQASHLLLVEAVAGAELAQAAYDAAASRHYAWHEFGDSALFLPSGP